eukprot:scaffold397013_cov33-Prasinocladus_malaysianus.AAC.1
MECASLCLSLCWDHAGLRSAIRAPMCAPLMPQPGWLQGLLRAEYQQAGHFFWDFVSTAQLASL